VTGPAPDGGSRETATVADELADVLASASEELPDVSNEVDVATTTWAVGARRFAVLFEARVEFRLDPLVARAALRTSDTAPSPRGADWVAFEPAELDDAAIDRVEAWFLSAYRRAAGGAGRGSASG
jgi:hypothetical protein